ncbi:glycosyltransferase family 4 protein, partial [Escherichia coli]|uniref:glycosyltransferase n=1 Tax=Escherichia coli TaxID=562 RepID=UPI00135D7EBA
KIIDKLPKEEFEKTLSSSCFLLLPSRVEGCPMVLLEALRFGVIPIVSNGKGAMREIVRHGVNGFICDLNNWCDEAYSILRNPPDDAYLKYMS